MVLYEGKQWLIVPLNMEFYIWKSTNFKDLQTLYTDLIIFLMNTSYILSTTNIPTVTTFQQSHLNALECCLSGFNLARSEGLAGLVIVEQPIVVEG